MRRILTGAIYFMILAGCTSGGSGREESLGLGIVRGTLGAHSDGHLLLAQPAGTHSAKGYVLAIEGGAYVLRLLDGSERRVAIDQNSRIDRPAHVGDKIEVFLDDRERAVLIRNIDYHID